MYRTGDFLAYRFPWVAFPGIRGSIFMIVFFEYFGMQVECKGSILAGKNHLIYKGFAMNHPDKRPDVFDCIDFLFGSGRQ